MTKGEFKLFTKACVESSLLYAYHIEEFREWDPVFADKLAAVRHAESEVVEYCKSRLEK